MMMVALTMFRVGPLNFVAMVGIVYFFSPFLLISLITTIYRIYVHHFHHSPPYHCYQQERATATPTRRMGSKQPNPRLLLSSRSLRSILSFSGVNNRLRFPNPFHPHNKNQYQFIHCSHHPSYYFLKKNPNARST
jgi:hypothetical protein